MKAPNRTLGCIINDCLEYSTGQEAKEEMIFLLKEELKSIVESKNMKSINDSEIRHYLQGKEDGLKLVIESLSN